MKLLGIIGTAAAWLNYQKAKKEYELALQESDDTAILAAISQYNGSKWENLEKYDKELYFNNKTYDGLLPVPVLNVGMLVGNLCRIQPRLALMNTGDETINIYSLGVLFYLNTAGAAGKQEPMAISEIYEFGMPLTIKPKQKVTVQVQVRQTEDITGDWFTKLTTALSTAVKNSLSDVYPITEAMKAIKEKLINSSPNKVTGGKCYTILDVPSGTVMVGNPPFITANVAIMYNTDTNKDVRRALFEDCKGSLCYKGEAFYPGSKWEVIYE